jgi:hypothetical protein
MGRDKARGSAEETEIGGFEFGFEPLNLHARPIGEPGGVSMFRTFHRILIAAGLMLVSHAAFAENRVARTH